MSMADWSMDSLQHLTQAASRASERGLYRTHVQHPAGGVGATLGACAACSGCRYIIRRGRRGVVVVVVVVGGGVCFRLLSLSSASLPVP